MFSLLICVRLFKFTVQPEERKKEGGGERGKGTNGLENPTERDRKQMEWKEKQDRERGGGAD